MPEGGNERTPSRFIDTFRGLGEVPQHLIKTGDFLLRGSKTTVSGKAVQEAGRDGGFVLSTAKNNPGIRAAEKKAASTAQFDAQLAASNKAYQGFLDQQSMFDKLIAQFTTPADPSFFGQAAPLPFEAAPFEPVVFDNTPLPGVGSTSPIPQSLSTDNPAAAFAPQTIVTRAAGENTTKPIGVGTPIQRVLGERATLGNQGKF